MKRLILFLLLFTTGLTAQPGPVEAFEGKPVAQIEIRMMNLPSGASFDTHSILSQMTTKEGDPFNQIAFDRDLKHLSKNYERVDPSISVRDGELYIVMRLWEKPIIRSIKWHGNSAVSSRRLARELDVKPHTVFDRKELSEGLKKVKDLYIKKSYFEVSARYKVTPVPDTNEVNIDIYVNEGRSARVGKIIFEGFTEAEQTHLRQMINTKKYDLFTSWMSGDGVYHEEMFEHDRMTIINYLQNQGYADAHVSFEIKDSTNNKKNIYLVVKAEKGPIYRFGDVTFSGNAIHGDDKIKGRTLIKKGDKYSPDKLKNTAEAIKDLYGHEGYIETSVQYELTLQRNEPVYNVHFTIEESEKFRIGVIRVLGNHSTQNNVIMNESRLVPGEIFDERKLKATQMRLEAIGYFKSVNVYAIRSPDDQSLGPEYRDVVIEVEESMTGNMSMFFGLSSTDSIFGGLDVTENNFNWRGLGSWWREGWHMLRGGGQFASMKLSIGKKEGGVDISWVNPYFNDTNWRVGFDLGYSQNRVQAPDFIVHAFNFNLFGSYPITSFWRFGLSGRFRDSLIKVKNRASIRAQEQKENSGNVYGFGGYLTYDSTDNPTRPHRGLRSTVEGELDGVHRRRSGKVYTQYSDGQLVQVNIPEDQKGPKNFPFIKLAFTNSYYYPVWKKGTFKLRADLRFLETFGAGKPIQLPVNERYYLGGETTVRGYTTAIIGPAFITRDPQGVIQEKDPQGGASSALFSAEYMQNIIKPVDAFTFYDAGAVSSKEYKVGKLRMSWGVGVRLNVGGGRLPMVLGVGFPINPEDRKQDVENFFFSMGGQF
ncbi:MAG: outer membrane protein assembly factor BamA [Simkaniaceae bacterium]|nr:outer membrane protein assembly factor BamA [Simkaniaceae bacterium]